MHNHAERLAILERRKKVAARYVRGQPQWEIARAFEVDQATISRDLAAIQKEWLEQSLFDAGVWIARELAKLDEIERCAWSAWERSLLDAEVREAATIRTPG